MAKLIGHSHTYDEDGYCEECGFVDEAIEDRPPTDTELDRPTIDWLIDEIAPNKGKSPLVNFNKKRLKALIDKQVIEGRIKALTDVDNLNLLNDSDDWHEFYLKEIATLKDTLKDKEK